MSHLEATKTHLNTYGKLENGYKFNQHFRNLCVYFDVMVI